MVTLLPPVVPRLSAVSISFRLSELDSAVSLALFLACERAKVRYICVHSKRGGGGLN